MTSTLDTAREDLWQRVWAAEKDEDWALRDILSPLATVADYVCRIGDHTTSAHYQASKASVMVDGAIRTQAAAFARYHSAVDEIADESADRLIELASAITACLWTRTRTERGVYESDARGLREAFAALGGWVEKITANPLPEPID